MGCSQSSHFALSLFIRYSQLQFLHPSFLQEPLHLLNRIHEQAIQDKRIGSCWSGNKYQRNGNNFDSSRKKCGRIESGRQQPALLPWCGRQPGGGGVQWRELWIRQRTHGEMHLHCEQQRHGGCEGTTIFPILIFVLRTSAGLPHY